MIDQLDQLSPALIQRQRTKVAAVAKEQVERVKYDFSAALAVAPGLEGGKASMALLVQDDGLAV
jgi:hypothetical protein